MMIDYISNMWNLKQQDGLKLIYFFLETTRNLVQYKFEHLSAKTHQNVLVDKCVLMEEDENNDWLYKGSRITMMRLNIWSKILQVCHIVDCFLHNRQNDILISLNI
jgi:hypothetical protein